VRGVLAQDVVLKAAGDRFEGLLRYVFHAGYLI
jgi:hypothetical protein